MSMRPRVLRYLPLNGRSPSLQKWMVLNFFSYGTHRGPMRPPSRRIYCYFLLVLLLMFASSWAIGGTVTYVYTDAQGTPLSEADALGNVTANFDYRPYGSTYSGAGMSSAPDGVGYTGHVSDLDTSLIYMQARYYDSSVGRFLSPDPEPITAGALSSFNRFVYADNSPLDNTDPDGRQCYGSLCDDYRKVSKLCELTCLSEGAQQQSHAQPATSPSVTTLSAVSVTATAETAAEGIASRAALSPFALTALGASIFVMDANGFHDMIYGRQGCYGSISCGSTIYLNEGKKIPKPGVSGKEGSKDAPSWAKGERPNIGESGKDFADRLFGKKYGRPPTDTERAPGKEWNQIKKWGDRSFTDP